MSKTNIRSNNSKYAFNYEEFIDELLNAYCEVIGTEYREVLEQRLKKLKIINYYTDGHLHNYLNRIGQPINEQNELDEYMEYYKVRCMEELRKKYKDNNFFNSNTTFPLFFYMSYNYWGEFRAKRSLLEDLGILEKVTGIGYLKEDERIQYEKETNETWEKYFKGVLIEDLVDMTKKYMLEYNRTKMSSEGNIKDCVEFGKSIYHTGELFSVDDIIKNNKLKCCRTVIKEGEKDIITVIINPILFLYNPEMLMSIIHEITHGMAVEKIEKDSEKWEIKMGLEKSYLINSEEVAMDDCTYFNEAVTQYIAAKVTQILIDKGLDKLLFNFEIPKQEANLYSSYPGCLKLGKDFIEKNKNILFGAYIQDSKYSKFKETIDLSLLEELFKEAFSCVSEDKIEELKSRIK